jgi:hypothetical protein
MKAAAKKKAFDVPTIRRRLRGLRAARFEVGGAWFMVILQPRI